MDPRQLLKLAPALLRAPLAALLDRLEALEKRTADLEIANGQRAGEVTALREELSRVHAFVSQLNQR